MRRIALLLPLLLLAGVVPAGAATPPAAAANEPRLLFAALVNGPHTKSGRGSDQDVWSVRADGTGLVRLSTSGGTKGVPTASPDGLQAAWAFGVQGGAHGIEVGSVLGGPTRVLVDEVGGSTPQWSPLGDRLAYGSGRRLRVMDVASGVGRTAFTSPKGDIGDVGWSAVSERVAAVSTDYVDSSLTESHLWLGRADGTGWREITVPGFGGDGPVWAPGEDRFVVGAGGRLTIVTGDGVVQPLAIQGSPWAWGPDGRIYYSNSSQQPRSVRPDGTDDRPFTAANRPVGFSQDGTRITYADGVDAAYVADADGSDVHRLPDATSQGATRSSVWLSEFVPTAFGSTARAAGADRVATAVEVARRAFPSAGTVVVARKDTYADALAAAPLGGPVLLVDRDDVPATVQAEIRRLGATRALVMGTADALGAGVEADLRGLGLTVERVGGADRFATAAAAAARLPAARHGWLVKGFDRDAARGWEDAVAVSAVAASAREPILLTTTDDLPAATLAALDRLDSVTIVGGTAAVSDAVAARVRATGATVDRVAGADRYATAVAVAGTPQAAALDGSTVWLASGAGWPDAVAAGPAAAAGRSPLLLVDRDALDRSAATRSWLSSTGRITSAVLVGGTGAVSLSVARSVRSTLDA